jgi:SAM-dependent methyltransferase
MTGTRQTYSTSHIRRQRDAHRRADGYGRHRHLYLHDTMRRLAALLRQANATPSLTWLDYGCGKGAFIEEIRALGLFAAIAGYDPAVDAFRARPSGRHDIVTCLDVIDIVEPRFLPDVLMDVAGLTGGIALFDCLTRPKPGTLRPHPPFYWTYRVSERLAVLESRVEFPGLDGFERVVIVAAPREHAARFAPSLRGG